MATWLDIMHYTSGDTADGGNFEDYNSGDSYNGGTFDDFKKYHHFYFHHTQPTVAIDDVVITGVKVEINNTETPLTAFYGTEGYVISIVNNPLIQSQADADSIAASVGAKIVGMRFRPFSATVLSDPSIEAGDACYLTVRTNQGWFSYQSYITCLSYKVNSPMQIRCDAKTASRNSATRYSEATKTYVEARKATERKLTAYDLTVQQFLNLMTYGFGLYRSEDLLSDGSTIYYMHDKPTRAESSAIWKFGSNGIFLSTDHGLTWGVDTNGNMLVNVLTAVGINADWIRTGSITSPDGRITIDLNHGAFILKDANGQALITSNGVASTDNISFSDNIQSGFPLTMPFRIDNSVSKIQSIVLNYTQHKFRTSSTTASSGGATSSTSSTAPTLITVSMFSNNEYTDLAGYSSGSTGPTTAESGKSHNHTYTEHDHRHSFKYAHSHAIYDEGHSHSFYIPSHSHGLNFGIQETPIIDNTIQIYVDGDLRATVTDLQGTIDLTEFITTVGWHTIEIRSDVLKRISAQIFIKSYVRM